MFHALKQFIRSFFFAGRGIITVMAGERNMRVHVSAALAVIALGAYFRITATEWCVVVLCIGIVMTAEMFNTAIESLTDMVQPELHPLAGRIKDVAAGGVLLVAMAAAIAGMLVFWKYLFGG